VCREDLAGVEGDDSDLLLVDDGEDPPAGEGRADLEVVQAAGPPQGDGALAVGDVVADFWLSATSPWRYSRASSTER
jgi:hypothetical protein